MDSYVKCKKKEAKICNNIGEINIFMKSKYLFEIEIFFLKPK